MRNKRPACDGTTDLRTLSHEMSALCHINLDQSRRFSDRWRAPSRLGEDTF
jgi:hypothetical protein